MPKTSVHVYISGRVQGVGYRYSALHKATSLGLTGWVKNLFDGRVEALIEGEEELVNQMILWCKQGPSMSYVTNVESHKKEYTGQFNDFSITG
ncbi:MAG: acylphosphatase [Vampirovibrionia bacterium]